MESKVKETLLHSDLYSLLYLSKNATGKEISTQYRRLSLVFMPDKQEESLKKQAQEQFYIISVAHAILKNEKAREIYDKFGKEGLNLLLEIDIEDPTKLEDLEKKLESSGIIGNATDKMLLPEVDFTYSFTPLAKFIPFLNSLKFRSEKKDTVDRKMIEDEDEDEYYDEDNDEDEDGYGEYEYEDEDEDTVYYVDELGQIINEEEEEEGEEEIFDQEGEEEEEEYDMNDVHLNVTNEIPLSENFTTNYVVNYSKGGPIEPSLNLRRSFELSPSQLLVLYGEIGSRIAMRTNLQQRIDNQTIIIVGASKEGLKWNKGYGYNLILMRKLCKNWQFVANLSPTSFKCSVKNKRKNNYKISYNFLMHYYGNMFSLAERNNFSVKLTKSVSESTSLFAEVEWQKYINADVNQYLIENIGITHKINDDTKISLSSSLFPNSTIGLLLRAKYKTINVNVPLYIFGSEGVGNLGQMLIVLGLSLATPLLKLAFYPFNSRKKENERIQQIVKNIEKKRKEAEIALKLMENTAKDSIEGENSKPGGGLIIVKATYGKLDSNDRSCRFLTARSMPTSIDVTIPVQVMVTNSRIENTTKPKYSIDGFYDPTGGECEKLQLHIVYRFKNVLHEITYEDDQPIRIPLKRHRMEN